MSTHLKLLQLTDSLVYDTVMSAEFSKVEATYDDNSLRVTAGDISAVVRFKTSNSLKGTIAMNLCQFVIMVLQNGYRIVGKTHSSRGSATIQALDLKIGGQANRKNKGYTVVAMLTAFPDVAGEICVKLQERIKAQSVGGYKFTGSEFPTHLYLNGSHTLVIDEEDAPDVKDFIATAYLAHTGCYISTRAKAGSKTAPNAEKIKAARIQAHKFIKASGNTWSKANKEEVYTRWKIPRADTKAKLIAIGKALGKYEDWPTDATTFLDAAGTTVGWVKV
jgi:hypothetical protein